jgi:hypothetical protein
VRPQGGGGAVGNNPSQLHALAANVQFVGDVRAGVEGFMTQEMWKAFAKFALLKEGHKELRSLLAVFKSQDSVPRSYLEEHGLQYPTKLYKVLHATRERGKMLYVPYDPCMALVLRYNLSDVPSFAETLRLLVKEMNNNLNLMY